MTVCVDDNIGNCAIEHNCLVKPHWKIVNASIRGALADINLTPLSKVPVTSIASNKNTASLPSQLTDMKI